jgi:hypothetical protein
MVQRGASDQMNEASREPEPDQDIDGQAPDRDVVQAKPVGRASRVTSAALAVMLVAALAALVDVLDAHVIEIQEVVAPVAFPVEQVSQTLGPALSPDSACSGPQLRLTVAQRLRSTPFPVDIPTRAFHDAPAGVDGCPHAGAATANRGVQPGSR